MYRLSLCADPSALGRLNYESMTQQALMEMVISQMNEEDQDIFKDANGHFLDLSEWPGVTLNDDDAVDEVVWGYEDPQGEKPDVPGKILWEWFPETVEEIWFTHRGYHGTVEFSKIPKNLLKFAIDNNQFMGTLIPQDIPTEMNELRIDRNFFSGVFDLLKLPKSITYLSIHVNNFHQVLRFDRESAFEALVLGENQLIGSLEIDALPQKLQEIIIEETSLEGSLELMKLPSHMTYVGLSKNKFSGEISLKNLPNSLEKLYLHKNRLSGGLDLTQLPGNLQSLWLNGNSFEGTLTIADLPESLQRLKVLKNNNWAAIEGDEYSGVE